MKRVIAFCAIILTASAAMAQDIHFSVLNASPLYYNPAAIGQFRGDRYRMIANYKNQWSSIANPYSTIAFTTDAHFFGQRERAPYWGFGLGVYSDGAGSGAFKNMHFDLGASYNLWLNKFNIFSFGLMAGAGTRSFDVTNLTWDNQFDGDEFNTGLASGETTTTGSVFYPDVATGIHWRFLNREETVRIMAGLGLFHLNNPNISMGVSPDRLYEKLVSSVMADFSISSEKTVFFSPAIVNITQGPHTEWIAGGAFKFHLKPVSEITDRKGESSISFGLYNRVKDAWIVNVKGLFRGFGFGISYDINTSPLKAASKSLGGPELTVSFVPTMSKIAKINNHGWTL